MGRFLRAATQEMGFIKQPLPLMGVYSSYSNSPDCSIYDSDFNLVSRSNQSNAGNAWATAGEIWSDYTGWNYTNGQVSSSSAGSYWVKATPACSADGHQLLRLSPNGGMAGRHPEQMAGFMANFGVIIGPAGSRQPMSLWFSNNVLRQYPRGGFALLDQLTTGLNSASAADWAGTSTASRGSVGYHRESGLLVVIEAKDAACNYRAHLWRHPKRPLSGKPGELDRFILEAKAGTHGGRYQSIDFTWSANGSTNAAESLYRLRVIPTTSGKIALARFVPSACTHMAVLTPEGSGNTGTLDTSFTTVSCTTSYGIEQGNYYGMRHQITWDNCWVAVFAPYYYYGSGLAGFVINTDDPSQYARLSYPSSSCGVSLIPLRESGFAFSFNESNADSSQGMNVGLMDFSTPGFQPSGLLANGGVVSLATSRYWIDTGYTSTNYPCLLPVEHWTI